MVAPNPATTRFQLIIASITNETVAIRITDINGRVVEQVNRAGTNSSVFVGEKLQPGIYFAVVCAGNEKQTVKLIKIK